MYMYLVNKLSLSPNWTRNYAPFTPPKTTRRDATQPSHLIVSRRAMSGTDRAGDIYTARQKKINQFSFVCIFLVLDRNGDFFAYIRPKESGSISYNSVCLILACVEKFAATVSLHILFMFTSQVMKLMITG